ncbi:MULTISPECIES: hypothetical protein [Streptomyces]|uniref:Uncharacterized protein n=1 Tax=Streptomyces fimbriatus TaxID=68197 RepID=A0ABW0DIN0_STRFI
MGSSTFTRTVAVPLPGTSTSCERETTSAPAAFSKTTVTVKTPSTVWGLVTSTVAYGAFFEAQLSSSTVASRGDEEELPPLPLPLPPELLLPAS